MVGCDRAYTYKVDGVLARADGQPLVGVPIVARADFPMYPEERDASTRTDGSGRFQVTADSLWLRGNLFHAGPPRIAVLYLYLGDGQSTELPVRVELLAQPAISCNTRQVHLPDTITLAPATPPVERAPSTAPVTEPAAQ